MRSVGSAVLLSLIALGCGGRPQSDQLVPIETVPPVAMEAARKELPGIKFDTVYKMKVDGKDAFEIRGKDSRGKVREVEVSTTGEILEIE